MSGDHFRNRVTVLLTCLLGGMGVILLAMDIVRGDWKFVFIEGAALLAVPVLLALVRAGRQEGAAHLLMAILWAATTSALCVGSGLWSVTMIHLMLIVVASGDGIRGSYW